MSTLELMRSIQGSGGPSTLGTMRAIVQEPPAPSSTLDMMRLVVSEDGPPADQEPSQLKSTYHAAVQGAAAGVASLPERYAAIKQVAERSLMTQYDKIDAGEAPALATMGGDAWKIVRYRNAKPEVRKMLRAELDIKPVEEETGFKIGQRLRDAAQASHPIPAKHQDKFLTKLGHGVGSTGIFFAMGAVGRLFGLPALGVAAGTGAAVNSAETFRDALSKGASFEDAMKASNLSAVVGLSEGLPIAQVFDRFDKATGGHLKKTILDTVKGGVEEGAQEVFQTVADNLIASKLVAYDKERGVFTTATEAGEIGFTVGALFSGLASMLGVKMRGGIDEVTTEAIKEASEVPDKPFVRHDIQESEGLGVPEGRPAQKGPVYPVHKPTKPLGKPPVRKKPLTLSEFLSKEGGVQDQTGELKGMDAHLWHKDKPFRSKLVTDSGLTPDYAREAAAEAGYLPQDSTVADLYDALDRDLRSGVLTIDELEQTGRNRDAMEAEASYLGIEKAEEFSDDDLATAIILKRSEFGAEETDQGPQTVIPGAGQISERELAERRMQGSKVSGKPQKPADEGLFDVAGRGQIDIGDVLPETAFSRTDKGPPGDQYIGMRPDEVTGTRSKKPLRREKALAPLLKALGVPLYQGRIKSRRFLGFYRRRIEEVRIKNMNDIEVAAHELAHMLDDRIPEIRRQWNPATKANKVVREELRGVSYDQSKLFEGFAEFVRLRATNKGEARERAPQFYGWFEDFLNRNEHGKALRKAQEDFHVWFAQHGIDRARSKIGASRDINAHLNGLLDNLRQGFLDDLHGVMRMEKSLTGGLSSLGAYETARLTRGKYAIVEGVLRYGHIMIKPDGSYGFEGKGLEQILDPIAGELEDFLSYAVGRSAAELKSQGRENLFTKAEIQAMLELERDSFVTAFDEYQEWNRALVDFAQAKGAIDPQKRALWQRAQYLPFYRVGKGGPAKQGAPPGDWKGIKALTGGTSNLRDILGNMIGNATMLVDVALTNEARQKIADLANLPGGAHFMAKIPKDGKSVRISQDEMERAIWKAMGIPPSMKELAPVEIQMLIDQITLGFGDYVNLFAGHQAPKGQDVVAVLKGGKPEYYQVIDPILLRAITRLQRPHRHWMRQVLSMPRRIGQMSITLTADFMMANMARDTLMGTIMSRHGFRFMVDSASGMKSRIAADQNYKDFIANGGGFASYLVDEEAFRGHLDRFYAKKGINPRYVIHRAKDFFFALERIADAFEMSTRLGEFQRATQKGEHPRHAAYSAREVSTDFGMRGDFGAVEWAYDTIIFLKAAMNGMDRLYRGLAHDPNRVRIAVMTGGLAALSMGLYVLNRGNPLYDRLEDWDKDSYWHFYIPKQETIAAHVNGTALPPLDERYHHFRYPKIWEIGAVASISERTLGAFLDQQPEDLAEDVWRIMRNVFNVEYVPQAIAPLYEMAINEHRFSERPIETQAMQDRLPYARTSPYMSRTMQAFGEAERGLPPDMQLSPAQLEALLRGYLNTWAYYGLTLSDAMFFDDQPDLRVDQYPVFRRFYSQEPARHTRFQTEFWDTLKEVTQVRRTMRWEDRNNRPDFAAELENTPGNLLYSQLSNAQKQMFSYSAEMRQVISLKDLEGVQAYAENLGRERAHKGHIAKMRSSNAWDDMGRLKRELMDMWTRERNRYIEGVMRDVETRKAE